MLMYVIMQLRVNKLTGFNVAFLHYFITFFKLLLLLLFVKHQQHTAYPCYKYKHFFSQEK